MCTRGMPSIANACISRRTVATKSSSMGMVAKVLFVVVVIILQTVDNDQLGTTSLPFVDATTILGTGSRAWARLYDRAFQAYSLERNGEATISYSRLINSATQTQSEIARQALAQNLIDFATPDTLATTQDLLTTPDMIVLPTSATPFAPVFNLPGISSGQLILDTYALAYIHMGNFTMWNHPYIQALNPALVLPALPITRIVRTDVIPLNTVLDQALDTVEAWANTVTTTKMSQYISYPPGGNGRSVLYECPSAQCFFNILSTVVGACGVAVLDDANRLGITYSAMVNLADNVVLPSVDSTLFTIYERSAQSISDAIKAGQPTFNMNSLGLLSWPLILNSYVALRTNTYRDTCRVKTETVRFWYWFYTSDVAKQIATALSFVIPPPEIRQRLGIENTLTTAMYCEDALSYPVVRTGISLGSGSAIAADLFNVYPPIYNALSSTTGTITFQQTGSDRSLSRLLESEVDFASVMATVMAQDNLSDALDGNKVMLLPMFMRAVLPIYSLPTLSSSDNLILSFEIMALIWRGDITRWDDQRIALCNPLLAAANKLPAMNITLVYANAGDRDPEKLFMQALAYQTLSYNEPFNITYDNNGATLPYSSSIWYTRVMTRSIIVADDRKVDGVITATPGAIGVAMFDVNLASRKAQIQLPSGDIVINSPEAIYQCLIDTFHIDTMRAKLHQSSRDGCWPLSGIVYTVVRPDNDASVCTNTAAALKFLQYMHAQTSPTAEVASSLFATNVNDALTEEALAQIAALGLVTSTDIASQLGLLWMPPQIRSLVLRKLQTITCEGETILVTLPVPHPLSSEVESAALAISIIGYVLAAVMLCFLYFFHLRTAIKASSPLFLLATLSGVILLLVSGTLMANPSPTNSSCRSAWWTINIGFFLTFAPLFAKCWRIYKIFMRKEMTVIRITDSNLIVRLSIALAIQVIFLAVIEGVDPFAAVSMVQSALPRDQIIYFCAPQSPALGSTLAACYGLMLLFGALMSFSTRSVAEHFNESRTIAFAIYNVLFTLAIIIPIALLQKSDGRTIWMLIIFVTFWITLCTFLMSFLPKVHAIYQDASGFLAARVSDSRTSNSDGNGSKTVGKTIKDFVSQPIRLMDRASLKAYLFLLEREVNIARSTLATLEANEGVLAGGRGGGGGGGGNETTTNNYMSASTPKGALAPRSSSPSLPPRGAVKDINTIQLTSTTSNNPLMSSGSYMQLATSTPTGAAAAVAATNNGYVTTNKSLSLQPSISPSSAASSAASVSSSYRYTGPTSSPFGNTVSNTNGGTGAGMVYRTSSLSMTASLASSTSSNASSSSSSSSIMASHMSPPVASRSLPPSSRAVASFVAPSSMMAPNGSYKHGGSSSNHNSKISGTDNSSATSPSSPTNSTRSTSPQPTMIQVSQQQQQQQQQPTSVGDSNTGNNSGVISGSVTRSGTPVPIDGDVSGIGGRVLLTVDTCAPSSAAAAAGTNVVTPVNGNGNGGNGRGTSAGLRPQLLIHTSTGGMDVSSSTGISMDSHHRVVSSASSSSAPTMNDISAANGLPH